MSTTTRVDKIRGDDSRWQTPRIPPEVEAERAIASAVWFHSLPAKEQQKILAEQRKARGE